MQNSEREQFEQGWKAAFDGAEMNPSSRLWDSIEMELAGSENASMKRRVVFYQRLAAATVLFALLSGAYAVYTYKGDSQEVTTVKTQTPSASNMGGQSLAQSTTSSASNTVTNATPSSQGNTSSAGRSNSSSNRPPDGVSREIAATNTPPSLVKDGDSTPVDNEGVATSGQVMPEESAVVTASVGEKSEQTKTSLEEPAQQEVVTILSAEEINALAEAKAKEDEKKDNRDMAPWLGVGGAAGSYAPNASVSGANFVQADQTPSSYSSSQNIPQSYSDNVGSAYSAGVSGGLRFAKRWVIQSGLNYINQRIDYTTNFVGITSSNMAMALTKEYAAQTSMDVAVTNPYVVSSASEILSIPIQAGFLIIDRKFGWQLNTGMSTDFLIRNTLTDKSGTRGKVSEGAGEHSPYRAVNGAVLLNTELSYRIGEHYRLALVPGFRYSLKPMLKENVTGSPLVMDVGFRFKYLFN